MTAPVTCLAFPRRGEEAVRFYVDLFPNSRILELVRYDQDGMMPAGALMAASFELDGRPFQAMDGGEMFTFSLGMSLVVACRDQAEIDRYWDRLVDGGAPSRCGWLTDRFGVNWQIVPSRLGELLTDAQHGDPEAALQEMLTMEKLDLARLEQAYARR